MTSDHDDEGLAPVTDLFGARSRRRAGKSVIPAASTSPTDVETTGARSGATDRGVGKRRGHNVTEPNFGAGADPDADGNVGGDVDADAPVPLPITGARAQADWLSPVVGDGSGRSARAEQSGLRQADTNRTDTNGTDTNGTGTDGTDTNRTATDGTNADGTATDGTNTDGTDTNRTDTNRSDMHRPDTAEATGASVFAIDSGVEIDPADAPRPLDEQRADAERLSMRALGRKGVSESELRTMLRKNDLDPDVVEFEVQRLTGVGLLDDLALATDLVDRLHDRKSLGRQGVVAELRRRGIDQTAIEAALEAAVDDDDDEFVRAIELAQKRAGQLRGLDRATAERRLSGFLMRKGYNGGVVRIAVERALDGGGRPTGGPRGPVRFE